MTRKSRIGLVLAILLFSFVILIFPSSAGDSVLLSTGSNYSENPEVSNVDFNYYTYFFGLDSYGNTVITRYGKLPVLDTNEQKENWNSTLERLGSGIKDTVASEYMYPHGEVVTCGTNAKGYFVILFRYGNVDESLMNEIYSLMDSYAKEMGIQDIPVEFGYGTYQAEIPLDREQGIYHTYGESTENLSESEMQAIEKYMKEKPEQLWGDGQIANYGKIPLLKDKKEMHSWFEKLSSIKYNTEEKILPYLENGQLVDYGIGLTTLSVNIYNGLPSEEKTSLTEEIYQIINDEAKNQNVTDVPVTFGESELVHTDEEVMEEGGTVEENTVELNNSSKSDSKSDNKDEMNKTNSIPGFELLGSFVCLCGGWKFKRNW
jgi:hypothetical protein